MTETNIHRNTVEIESEYFSLLKRGVFVWLSAWLIAGTLWFTVGVVRSGHTPRADGDNNLWQLAQAPGGPSLTSLATLALSLPAALFIATSLRPVEPGALHPREAARDALTNDMVLAASIFSCIGMAAATLNAARQNASLIDIALGVIASIGCSTFAALHRESPSRIRLTLEQVRRSHERISSALQEAQCSMQRSPTRWERRSPFVDHAVEALALAICFLAGPALVGTARTTTTVSFGLVAIAIIYSVAVSVVRRAMGITLYIESQKGPRFGFSWQLYSSAISVGVSLLSGVFSASVGLSLFGPIGLLAAAPAAISYMLFRSFTNSITTHKQVVDRLTRAKEASQSQIKRIEGSLNVYSD